MEMDRMIESSLAAKRSAAFVGNPRKATGLLPRSLPRVARPVASKPEKVRRAADAMPASQAKAAPARPAPLSPSFARMAACMRFRGYIAP